MKDTLKKSWKFPNTANRVALVVAVVSLLAAVPSSRAGLGSAGNPGVIPPEASPKGTTCGEWAARWWQWALGAPADQSPLLDETGEFCHVGQSGSVWFLAGTFGGTVERTCTVPTGKALFVPLLNNAWFSFCTDEPLPEDCLLNNYNCLRSQIRLPDNVVVSCEIDGRPVENLSAYYTESPAFALDTTADSLAAAFGFPVCRNGPCVDNGYYLMIAPLKAGFHTIHFNGRIPDGLGAGEDFITDVTYLITVK